MKVPKSLGACADALYQLRERRLAMQREVDELAAQESELREHVIATLPKSQATGVAGKVARVAVVVKQVPRVDDWDELRAYVKKTGAWELFHKRVADAAVKERWDAGEQVPGVGKFQAVTLSLVKV